MFLVVGYAMEGIRDIGTIQFNFITAPRPGQKLQEKGELHLRNVLRPFSIDL